MNLIDIARQFNSLGANVTAIEAGSKGPAHTWERWHQDRQRRADVDTLPWGGYIVRRESKRHKPGDKVTIGGVGIISGVGGWRVFDIDAHKDATTKKPARVVSDETVDRLLRSLGLPQDYPWVWRSGSGAGWEVAIRCDDPMPLGVLTPDNREKGVFTGWPEKESGADWHHLELRWEECQTVVVCNDGRSYAWRGAAPTEAPALLPIRRVLAAFFELAPPPPYNLGTADRDVIETIKARFDLVGFFKGELGGDAAPEGEEIRILGHQGLLVVPEKNIWYIHGEGIGGDAIDAVAYVAYGTTARNLNGKSAEILAKAATVAGVTIPDRKTDIITTIDGRTGEIVSEGLAVAPSKPVELIATPSAPIDVNDLLAMERKPTLWYAPGFLREGLGLLVGQPNVGKTPAAIQLALSIATGGKWFNAVQCERAKVLYLGMEYSPQELIPLVDISRCGQTVDRGWMVVKTIEDEFPTTPEEALFELEWYLRTEEVRVIIIDVLTAFLPPEKFKQNVYRGDYSELKPYHRLALQYNAAILGVWHASKREADPKLMYNGSTGMWAAAASRMAMYTDAEERVRISSFPRMGDRIDWALTQERTLTGRRWIVADAAPEPMMSPQEQTLYRWLKLNTDRSNPKTAATVAEMTGLQGNTVRTVLGRMFDKNLVQRSTGGGYYIEITKATLPEPGPVKDDPTEGEDDDTF